MCVRGREREKYIYIIERERVRESVCVLEEGIESVCVRERKR